MLSWPPATTIEVLSLDTDWQPSATAFNPDPHNIFTPYAGTDDGIPACSAAWRAGPWPWPEIHNLLCLIIIVHVCQFPLLTIKWLILPKKPLLSLRGGGEKGFFYPFRQLLPNLEFLLHRSIFLWVCYARSLTELSNDYLWTMRGTGKSNLQVYRFTDKNTCYIKALAPGDSGNKGWENVT